MSIMTAEWVTVVCRPVRKMRGFYGYPSTDEVSFRKLKRQRHHWSLPLLFPMGEFSRQSRSIIRMIATMTIP